MIDDDQPAAEDEQPEPERTVDAASEAGVDKQKRTARRVREEGDEFWRLVLSTPVGRREIWGLVKPAFETKFACGPNGFPQPEATWFHAGEHAHAEQIKLSLQIIDPDGFLQMLREHEPRFADRVDAPRRRVRKPRETP